MFVSVNSEFSKYIENVIGINLYRHLEDCPRILQTRIICKAIECGLVDLLDLFDIETYQSIFVAILNQKLVENKIIYRKIFNLLEEDIDDVFSQVIERNFMTDTLTKIRGNREINYYL